MVGAFWIQLAVPSVATLVYVIVLVPLIKEYYKQIKQLNLLLLMVWLTYAILRVVDAILLSAYHIDDIFWLDTVRHWVKRLGYALYFMAMLRLKKLIIYLNH